MNENYTGILKDKENTKYLVNGKLHRVDGPAWIHAVGRQSWWQNGLYHREGGPAIIGVKGIRQEWWIHGIRHREDGPAIIDRNKQSWYLKGNKINCSSQDEFERLMRLKVFW